MKTCYAIFNTLHPGFNVVKDLSQVAHITFTTPKTLYRRFLLNNVILINNFYIQKVIITPSTRGKFYAKNNYLKKLS
jgi:hypothetical protein